MQFAIILPAQLTVRFIDFVKSTCAAWKVVMNEVPEPLAKGFQNEPAGNTQRGDAKRHHGVIDPWPRENLGLRSIDPATEKKAMTANDQNAVTRLVEVKARQGRLSGGSERIEHPGMKRKADRFERPLPDQRNRAIRRGW